MEIAFKLLFYISYFCVTNNDILSKIKSLNSSKPHGYDIVSTKMIKIVVSRLESVIKGILLEIWKN